MAERPEVLTSEVSRDKLSTFLKSHELIKAFENIARDVSQTLPDAIAVAAQDADSVLAQTAFAHRNNPIPVSEDDAARIISTQIFGG